MLCQQIFAIIVTVRSPHYSVNVVSAGYSRWVFVQRAHWPLVVKFNQNNWAVDSIVKHRIICRLTNPREVRIIDMLTYLIHCYFRMRIP